MPEVKALEYRNLVFGLIALLGISQFLFSIVSMAERYPEKYRWHDQFISDLGRISTPSGLDNASNSKLFAMSSLVLGLSMLPFLLVFPSAFQRGRWILRVPGIITVSGLIGIGQTPYDQYFILHHVALVLWIVPMILLAVALPIMVIMQGGSPSLLLVLSLALLFAGIAYGSVGARSGYIVMQKIVVLISLVWFVVTFSTVLVVSRWTPSERQKMLATQATQYQRRLLKRKR